MTKWILGLLAAAAMVAPGTAAAEPFSPQLEADYSAALAWWGVASPPQCATVVREILPVDPFSDLDGDHAAAMRASEPGPGEIQVECHLYVFADAMADIQAEWGTGTECVLRQLARHEVGHLLGNGHSEDPENIMHEPVPAPECVSSFGDDMPELPGDVAESTKADNLWLSWWIEQGRCLALPHRSPRLPRCWQRARHLLDVFEQAQR